MLARHIAVTLTIHSIYKTEPVQIRNLACLAAKNTLLLGLSGFKALEAGKAIMRGRASMAVATHG